MQGTCHIEPAFIDAERLDEIGVFAVNGVDLLRIFIVKLMMRRQQNETGALLPGLINGFCRFYAAALGRFVFGKNDAVALRGITADRDGKLPQFRPAQKLAGGIEAVAVAMQNDAIHCVHLVSVTVYHKTGDRTSVL